MKVKVAGTGGPAGNGAGLPSGPIACLVAVIRAATDFGSAASPSAKLTSMKMIPVPPAGQSGAGLPPYCIVIERQTIAFHRPQTLARRIDRLDLVDGQEHRAGVGNASS